MKVAVIGCTHAGTAAILNIKALYKDAEVTVYERNDNISFLSCGIALNVSGVVPDAQSLFYSSPAALAELGVCTRMQTEVLEVDVVNKTLRAKDLKTGEEFDDTFDKLVVTTGSWPIVPKFEGGDLENILLSKNYDHSKLIIENAQDAQNVVVIGAGYIGVELAEAFEMLGKNTTLIDAESRIMNKYLDKFYTDKAEEAFKEHGVNLALNQKVVKFLGDENGKVKEVVTDQGIYKADLVVLCIGFRPNTDLFKGQLDMLPNGAIIIDDYMQTSVKDVFAAGDSCVVSYNPTGEKRYVPLATNAVRMGMLVARNLMEPKLKYLGTQSTSGIKIYDLNIAATGLTEEGARNAGFDVGCVQVTDNDRAEFMPTFEPATITLVFDKKTRRVLGGQIISDKDLTQYMNTLSVVIQNNMTVEELAVVDFFFQPHFNKPWSLLNTVALAALDK